MINQHKLQQRMRRMRRWARRFDPVKLPARVRTQSRELLETAMGLHGQALDRVLHFLRDAGEPGEKLPGSLVIHPAVSCVLLLCGFHRLDLQTRIAQTGGEGRLPEVRVTPGSKPIWRRMD
jgi:hypothetical protein